jgi:hypothetical protein
MAAIESFAMDADRLDAVTAIMADRRKRAGVGFGHGVSLGYVRRGVAHLLSAQPTE